MHSEVVKARDQDSHPEKTIGKITVLYPTKPWKSIKVNFYDDTAKCTYQSHGPQQHEQKIMSVFQSLGFQGWSSVCSFSIWDLVTSNTVGFPTFQHNLQLPSSGLITLGGVQ
jgi:hypothetical protein